MNIFPPSFGIAVVSFSRSSTARIIMAHDICPHRANVNNRYYYIGHTLEGRAGRNIQYSRNSRKELGMLVKIEYCRFLFIRHIETYGAIKPSQFCIEVAIQGSKVKPLSGIDALSQEDERRIKNLSRTLNAELYKS
ncbi:MAG: hypothetical protein WBC29_02460 [Candidatus Moraniibacteriota bacterium]